MQTTTSKVVNRATSAKPAAAAQPVLVSARPGSIQLAGAMKVSSPHDPAEREAEATSQRVMRMAEPTVGTSNIAPTGAMRSAQLARMAAPIVQRNAAVAPLQDGVPGVTSKLATEINAAKSSGTPLPPSVRKFMEPRFGADFSNVKVHANERAGRMSRQLSARAFTVGNQIFFGDGHFQPDSREGRELIAHELTHTIQQGGAAQNTPTQGGQVRRSPDITISQHSSEQVQRWGLPSPREFFANRAASIPGFTMFTVVIGFNPITNASVDRSAGNILKGAIEIIPGGSYITQALDNYGIFAKVSNWASQQFDAIKNIGSSLLDAIAKFIKSLSIADLGRLGSVWDRAKQLISNPVNQVIAFAKNLKDGIVKLVKDTILKPIGAYAKTTRGYDLLCAVMGKDPITGQAVPQDAETLIGGFMKFIGQDEVWATMKKANAIGRAFAWFKGAMAAVKGFVNEIPGLFIAAFKALEVMDIILIPRAFIKLAGVFGSFAGRFVTWAANAVWNLLEIIVDVVSPGAFGYIKRTGAALKSILKNPLPFVGNLVKAAKLGFQNFGGNFLNHLKAGLLDWLVGSLPGVYIPKALSLMEFGKLAISVLGISWAQIRGKIVKVLGPKGEMIMVGLEGAFDVVKALATGGPAAAWEVIKEKLSNLKDTIIDGIVGFIKDAVIQKAIPKLISMFIPGAGFIGAIMSIYDTVMVFVQKISKIIQVVTGFIDSIVAIAGGAIGAAANRVERTLAGLLSLAISFLAGFVGLGKVSDKVMGVVNKVRDKVDKAIDAAIAWVVAKAKALFGKLFGKGGKPPQAELDAAVQATEKIVDENPSLEGTSSQFTAIKAQYGLKRLDVKRTSPKDVQIEAEINPKKRETRKLTQAQRLKDCIKRNLHGKKVKIQGSGDPKRAAELAQSKLRQLRTAQTQIMAEVRTADIRLEAQERLARSRVTEAAVPAATQKARDALQRANARLQGVEAGIAGIEHEERVAQKEKPNLRNVIVICENCENVIQEFDMIKDKTILEAKITVDAVKVEQVKREQEIARRLWAGAKVELALPAGPRVAQQVKDKFGQAGEVPPNVRQY